MSQPDPQSTTNIQAGRDVELEIHGDFVGGNKIEGDLYNAGRDINLTYGLSIEEVTALVIQLKTAEQPTVWDGRIPYLGLSAFQESDAQFFFGRESLVAELLQRVQTATFIVITGPSGSGKSSVARAGLFHALRQGALPKSEQWRLLTMTPSGQPLEQLAVAIERLTGVMKSGNFMREEGLTDPSALHQQAEVLLTDDTSQRLVLLVDQFEESFTQTKDEAVRAAFIELLTTASQTPNGRAIIILSLRSDFISHCARYPDLRELMNKQFLLVGAMEAHDLAKAITLPALEVGAEIDPQLVSRILVDMKGEPGALPLMSFALRDLFEVEKTTKGQPMDLTLPEYLQRGGIEQALERHANAVFAGFTEEQKGVAKAVFSRLIEIGQGRQDTRRTAVFSELVPAGRSVEEVSAVVETLAREGARLLTTSGVSEADSATSTNVTIAHERLIDAWPWLRQLVDENRDAIALQNQIAHDAQAWAEKHDAGYLYRGGRLAQVQDKLQELEANLDEVSHQFIAASIEAAEAAKQAESERIKEQESLRQEQANASRFRRLTRWLSVAVGVAVVATIIALFFLNQSRGAEAEVQRLKNAIQASQLALEAHSELVNNPERSLLLAMAGLYVNIQGDTRRQLSEILQTPYRTTLYGHEDEVWFATFSSDGQRILTRSRDDTTRLWDGTGNQLAILPRVVAFSSDGQRIVTSNCAETNSSNSCINSIVQLWDGAGNQLAVLHGHENGVGSVVFSPSGQRIVTVGCDESIMFNSCINHTVRLWDGAGNELTVLHGHKGKVRSVVFSPDGQRIVTVDCDDETIRFNSCVNSRVRLWDGEGNKLAVLRGHQYLVLLVVFSPDGERLITADCDGIGSFSSRSCVNHRVRLWDGAGNELTVLHGHEEGLRTVVFNPDGQRIVTVSRDDNSTARLWDGEGNELAVLRHEGSIQDIIFGPDGQTILTTNWVDGTARLWDLAGNQLAVMRMPDDGEMTSRRVTLATFSPDGQRVVTANNNTTQLWDLGGNELARHERSIKSVVFSPDGQIMVAIENGVTPWLWDLAGNELAVLRGHSHPVHSAVFSPDGQTIVTASSDGTARLWDGAGNELAVFGGRLSSAVFSPDGQTILTISHHTVRLWDLRGNELEVLRGHEHWFNSAINSAVFSPDGRTIVTASSDATARLWDGAGNELAVLRGHSHQVHSAVFSPDGQTIVTTSYDFTARLWDRVGRELAVLRGHGGLVNSVIFSPDGQTIVTAGCDATDFSGSCIDGTVRLWDGVGNARSVLNGHGDRVYSAVFSPDGQRLLTASGDGTARLWDVTGNELAILHGHEAGVNLAIFSPDGQRIVTASEDGTMRLWDGVGNELIVLGRHEDRVNSAVFSSDGQRIVTASDDGTARLWDVMGNELGNELAVLRVHDSWFNSAVFSPDGQTIVTVSSDGTARLWDGAGNELAVLRGHEGSVNSAVFSPDGQTVLTASDDGTARLWPVYTLEYMVQEAFWRMKREFTEAECQQYFRDDVSACPRTKKQLFAPLVEYLSPEQQEEWTNLP